MFCFSSLIWFFFFFNCTFPWYSIHFVLYLLDLIIFSSDYENSLLLASYHLIIHSSIFFSSVLTDQMRGFSYSVYLFILTQYSINSVMKSFYLLFRGNRMLQCILLCNWIEISCHPPLKCKISAIVHFPLNLFYLSPSLYIISFRMILSAKVRWAKHTTLFMLKLFFSANSNL